MIVHPVLAADIGGTHCRLALFDLTWPRPCRHGLPEAGGPFALTLNNTLTLPTADMPHMAALVQAFAGTGCPVPEADMLAVAVAGPLQDADHAHCTNAALAVDMDIAKSLGARQCLLCNDFVAQAWACRSPAVADALPIVSPVGGTAPAQGQTLAVLGAGTGLGAASLVPVPGGGYGVQASEAGHMAFAFGGAEERACEDFMLNRLGVPFVTGDMLLSGRGLCLIHLFLTGEACSAPEIAARHLQEDSPTCRLFATFLGRMCRHWALSTLCRGGLYITGGVVAKNPVLAQCAAFRKEFFASPTHAAFLHTVPVLLNTNGNSGLWGAAWAGACFLQQRRL